MIGCLVMHFRITPINYLGVIVDRILRRAAINCQVVGMLLPNQVSHLYHFSFIVCDQPYYFYTIFVLCLLIIPLYASSAQYSAVFLLAPESVVDSK